LFNVFADYFVKVMDEWLLKNEGRFGVDSLLTSKLANLTNGIIQNIRSEFRVVMSVTISA